LEQLDGAYDCVEYADMTEHDVDADVMPRLAASSRKLMRLAPRDLA
jgi:hypothetical protein